jgi:hypothetical protein
MLRQNSNLFSVILSDVDQASSALPAVGTVVTSSNLAKGAVVLTDLGLRRMSNTEYAALANGEGFFIVQGKGASKPLVKTPRLTKGQVSIKTSKHKAAVQQVTTIGYNGTTGALPVANDTNFWIKLRKNDNDAANRSQPMSLFAGPVTTDASGTQAELADLLIKSGIKNMADEPANGYVAFEGICDEGGTANTVVAGTDLTYFQFVKGSKTVTGIIGAGGSPALGTDEVIDVIVAGDYLRVGAATTDAVYKVTAVTAGTATTPATMTLDVAFQGESVDIAYGSTDFITAAAAAAAEWGVKITGLPASFDVNKFRNYYANRFTATISDTDTLVTLNTGAQNGNGVWQQVALDEYMHYGFEGQNEMLAVPATMRDQEVKIPGVGSITSATAKYSVLALEWTEGHNTLVTSHGAKGTVLCYLNLDSAGDLNTGTENTGETLAVALLGSIGTNLDE